MLISVKYSKCRKSWWSLFLYVLFGWGLVWYYLGARKDIWMKSGVWITRIQVIRTVSGWYRLHTWISSNILLILFVSDQQTQSENQSCAQKLMRLLLKSNNFFKERLNNRKPSINKKDRKLHLTNKHFFIYVNQIIIIFDFF